jgi:integrase/recombinase XerD
LSRFIVWADERGIAKPSEITRPTVERFQRYLFHYRKPDGAPLTIGSQITALACLRAWFRWMARENHLLHNPAADLELPKEPMALPKTILTVAQVETIMNQADVATPVGVRDRAIMETFYSCGIRRMELMNLKLYDVDTERGTVMVRQGKGGRDRLVPLGERACRWIEKYVAEVRPELAIAEDERALFLDEFGRPVSDRYLGDLVRRYLEHAGIATRGSCHVFRHAMATHMLENGADIRYIQVMLGHANLETTQIYTRVSMTKLKEIHAATHPARLERTNRVLPSAETGAPETKNTSL